MMKLGIVDEIVNRIFAIDERLKGNRKMAEIEARLIPYTPPIPAKPAQLVGGGEQFTPDQRPAQAESELPPLDETGMDTGTILGGGNAFDALIKTQS